MKFLLLILTFTFGVGCKEPKAKSVPDSNSAFDKLVSIETPLTFNSNRANHYQTVEFQDTVLLKKLSPDYPLFLYGKIPFHSNFTTLIGYRADDQATPILFTFDKQGKLIHSHLLYETVVGDMGIYTSNHVIIDSERNIHFTDSTITRKLNEDESDEIPGTDSLSVINKKYRISDEGIIKRVD
ncbi:MAG TPA: hypothetical protein DIW47_09640 [Bacteroidetes bacterium]|nr:hypothetical protein [Bacteroidota bacterium]